MHFLAALVLVCVDVIVMFCLRFCILEVVFSFKSLRAGSQVFALLMLFLWSCGRLWYVCEVVVVPYVDAVVDVTVMRVLLFVLHVWLLRECDGVRLTAMLVWGMDEVW